MKIGTLSFGKKIEIFDLAGSERVSIITSVMAQRQPDLLVCAGWSVETPDDVFAISQTLSGKGVDGSIILEAQFDKLPDDKSNSSYHVMYIVQPDGCVSRLGRQIFAQAKDTKGERGASVIRQFEDSIAERQVLIGKRRVFSLCCGEINITHGRDTVGCVSAAANHALISSDLIVNPTHDLMGNHGTIIAKRKWLSRKIDDRDRIFISASNWDHAGYSNRPDGTAKPRHRQRPDSKMLHTIFVNGEQQILDIVNNGSDGFSYREWAGR